MTAFVYDTTTIGAAVIHSSAAANDSATFLQGLTFFNTNANAVNITHGNNNVYNLATIMSGGSYGLVVNSVNDCTVVNAASGTIATLAAIGGYSAVFLAGDHSLLQNAGQINSTGGAGVTLQGAGSVVENSGTITGAQNGLVSSASNYSILNTGTIQSGADPSGAAAIYMSGSGSAKMLVNSGLIQATYAAGGVAIAVAGNGLTTIVNSGTILAVGNAAIDASAATGGGMYLTNSGTITSPTAYVFSVAGSLLDDIIINTGTINRSVGLADGDDTFDGIGGHVGGTIFGGDGSDTFRVSDANLAIFEAVGEGLADVVQSTVSFALATGSEIEVLTLLGVATDGTGNEFNNAVTGNGTDNRLGGGAGNDTLNGALGNDILRGDSGSDFAYGGDGEDLLRGGSGADSVYGGEGDDTLWGDTSNDRLLGDEGEDVLIGGAGRDTLTGGADADTFVFRHISDSSVGPLLRDIITGFETELDLIDLTRIDANTVQNGNQAFVFLGTGAFTSVAGQLRVVTGANSVLLGDVNGDSVADFELQLNGIATISVNDILL